MRATRLGVLLGASLLLGLLVAAPANAGQARITARGGFTTLEYLARPGETNTVTIAPAPGGSFSVSDTTAPVTVVGPVSDGCVIDSLNSANCTAASGQPIQRIWVNLSNGNDEVTIVGTTPSFLFGRAGIDTLTGGDGPDYIEGDLVGIDPPEGDAINVRGPGPDTVKCDSDDVVVSDPDDVVSAACALGNNVAPVTTIGSGPDGPTNETLPTFSFAAIGGAEGGFECMIDPVDEGGTFPCDSPFTETSELAEGPYVFFVRAIDDIGPGPWTTRSFSVDTTAPQVNVAGPLVSMTATPTYELSSNELVELECRLDEGEVSPCTSPYTTPALANGTHFLFVTGTDVAGNTTTADVEFTVQVGGPGGGGGTTPAPVQPRRIIIESLVLISGRTVKMSRKGVVSIGLQCAGTLKCTGRMTITTAEPVKRRSRKLERLGSTRFSIAANKKRTVKVRFSKSKRKLAKRLKRFKAKVVITEVDRRGHQRISSRVFTVRAR